jgi:phytoene desaturase
MGEPVGIVGGGLGGLAAACTLAARGHEVIVWEKNRWLGGKAAVLRHDGFRFDMGPTILTMPRVLHRIFAEAGRGTADMLDLRRLDPQWRCFFNDGSVLDLSEETGAMAASLAAMAPGTQQGYRQYLTMSARLHEISERFLFWRSVEGVADTLDFSKKIGIDTLMDMMCLRVGSTAASQVRKRVGDRRVAQMLDHFVQLTGSSPFGSPAFLCGLAHMQTNDGVWYPMGGTGAVPSALESLARSLGVEFRTGLEVNRITTKGGRVDGVATDDGDVTPVSAVVSNMDSMRTYHELIGGSVDQAFSRRWKREPACSGVVLYLGLGKAYDHLAHHNFAFSRSPEEEFHCIYDRGRPAPDPTCYIAAPTRTEPGVAPPGGEALYVLVHTPYLRRGHNWPEFLPEYRRVIFDKLARTAGMGDLESRIVFEHVLTPQDIHDRYRVQNGAIYGLASHGRMFGAFKPGNRSRDLPGLYLAGGAAHPGPGMPMVMMSGWIAADALDADAHGAERFRA